MNGAARIFVYNWPAYVATWLGAAFFALESRRYEGVVATVVGFGALMAVLWSAISLLVSSFVYDRSELAAASWVSPLLPSRLETWATIDAGLDAELALDAVLPGACLARLDIYDGVTVRAPSVRRARARTPRTHAATNARADALPLPSGSCDFISVVFTAHEIRDLETRERFFVEVKRALRPAGRALLVEHLRDVPNFLAFGPGFLHFLPRTEWLRLARLAGLNVARETRVTPWVMALVLENGPEGARPKDRTRPPEKTS